MKDIISEYYDWHDHLHEDQKDKFDFIVNRAYNLCQKSIGKLLTGHELRDDFHLNYFKDSISFWKDELYNATKSLTDSKIDEIDYLSLSQDIKNQITRMKNAIAIDMEKDSDSNIEADFWDNEARFQSQFYCILWECDSMDEYLITDIDTNSDPKLFDVGRLRQFDILIDLMAQIEYIVCLFFEKEKGFCKSNPRLKKETTFKGLFRDKENAKIVKDIFERNEYTINGQWHGLTDDKGELSCAYYALKPLLIPGYKTPQVKTFYSEFGLPEDHMSPEMMRREPFNANRDEFERIFSHLMPKQKN